MTSAPTPPATCLVLLLTAAAAAGAPETPTAARSGSAGPDFGRPGGDPVFFREVRLFDGREVRASRDVLVRDGTVAAVGEDLDAPADATVVDGDGRTLVPGLIDAHVHTLDPASLRQAAVLGVTTVLDMFTVPDLARRFWQEVVEVFWRAVSLAYDARRVRKLTKTRLYGYFSNS